MLEKATELISNAKHITAFTGAGISVESGIPPFRGENGLWSKFDPILLDLDYFHKNPLESWKFIKEIFYDFFGEAKPNSAHIALAEMERTGLLNSIITQNIDNLHQQAGSKTVWEFHGTSKYLICEKCGADYLAEEIDLSTLPPRCEKCGAVLKPDFIFFGESIPEIAMKKSIEEAEKADLFLVIGTTGEIMPASMIPYEAKKNKAKIIEINTQPSNYTSTISDLFLQGKATKVLDELLNKIRMEI
jgi:NAD-dependent deacetylase